MKTNLLRFIWMVLIPVLLFSCTTSTSTSKLISIEDYTFARSGDGDQLIPVDDPAVFKRGEAVHLVLKNVGPFKKDDSGLNWFDLDMEIIGPDGEVLLSQTGLLGDGGHVALENNKAETPFATCTTNPDVAPGVYKFKLTIYDKIGSGKATQTASFTLE
jgi:hypothetical protein